MKHLLLKTLTATATALLIATPMAQVSAEPTPDTQLMAPEKLIAAINDLKCDQQHCNQQELNRLTINLIALTQNQLILPADSAALFVKIMNTSIECQNAKLIPGPGGMLQPVPKAQ
ncbi:MAG: hypothetical protein LUC43_07240 [Burkholderiales bacterium]|nr:hypothetical protein [Burkholderiales bacterium]